MGAKPNPPRDTKPASAAGTAGGRHLSYRSTQAMWGLWVILPLTAATVMAATWSLPQPPWAPALVLAGTLLPVLLLGRLVIKIRGDQLFWCYGYVGWPRWHITLDQVSDIRLSRGPAMHAGIQFNGQQRVYTARLGSPAVELDLRGGRRILLGSPEPERLAQFIRARLPDRR